MKKSNSNKVKQIITIAKQIPMSIYHLFFINLVLFVGLVVRDLSILYILGCFLFVGFLVTLLASSLKILTIPESFVSLNIKLSIEEVQNNISSFIKKLNVSQLGSSSINTVVTILLIVYTSSMLNQTLEIFIVFNLVFCSVFLPHETKEMFGMAQQNINHILGKIKYHQ